MAAGKPMRTDLYYEIDSLDYDHDLAFEFGCTMVTWSKAEDMLALASSAILGIEANVAAELMIRIPSFESRSKWIKTLLEHWSKIAPIKSKKVQSVVDDLTKLAKQRNDWVHGKWCKHQRSKRTMIFDLRKSPGRDRGKIITSTAVKNHRMAVRNLTDKLIEEFPGYLLASNTPIPENG